MSKKKVKQDPIVEALENAGKPYVLVRRASSSILAEKNKDAFGTIQSNMIPQMVIATLNDTLQVLINPQPQQPRKKK